MACTHSLQLKTGRARHQSMADTDTGFFTLTRSANADLQGASAPGDGRLPRVRDLAPLIRLVAGVQRPRVAQRLLAVVAAHCDQEAVRHQRQRVRVPSAGTRTLHHDPAHARAIVSVTVSSGS